MADAATIPQAGRTRIGSSCSASRSSPSAGSLATSTSLFPLGSINHDEPMYVFEAQMLRQGHVTLPARDAEFFRPWAAGVTDGRVVMKYTPPWPAVIAASQVVFGDGRAPARSLPPARDRGVPARGGGVRRWRVGLIAAACSRCRRWSSC